MKTSVGKGHLFQRVIIAGTVTWVKGHPSFVWGCVWVCVGVGVRMFMLSNEDTYMNFNLNTVDVPSNEDGPRSSDIGNDFNIT